MPFVLGDTIGYDVINIEVYNSTPLYTNGSITKIQIEIRNDQYVGNNKNFSFEINLTKAEDISFVDSFPFVFIKNDTAENLDFAINYYECVATKASLNTGYNACVVARDACLNDYEGENATNCQNDLNACALNIQQKDIEISGKQTTITNLENEKKDTKNSKYIWGIVCAVLGVVGCLIYQGKIGKGVVKDKSADEFNKHLQG